MKIEIKHCGMHGKLYARVGSIAYSGAYSGAYRSVGVNVCAAIHDKTKP